MAIGAEDCNVAASQGKPSVFMASQRKARGFETAQIVARLTAVLVREACELAFVNILVAILALRLRDFENGGFALRYVALVAGN
jgi:hypothetical protein